MKPVELAAAVYQREECARSFREDLEAHLLNGYVLNDPTAFIMGRPVLKDAPVEQVCDPWYVFEEYDCWHLYLFAGSLVRPFQFAPHRLPWVSFERKNKLRYHKWDDIWRKCESTHSSQSSPRCANTFFAG